MENFKNAIVVALNTKTIPEGWTIKHSYEVELHEIHIRTPNRRAWVYEAKEQPQLPDYKNSGWCIEVY
jgi:hypothetical protein